MQTVQIENSKRIEVKTVNPWEELYSVIERVSDRAESLGLTEEKLEELLKE